MIILLVMLIFVACSRPRETDYAPLQRLLEGNQRYLGFHSIHPNQTKQRLKEISTEQKPFAVVVSCSDSRVPPEILIKGLAIYLWSAMPAILSEITNWQALNMLFNRLIISFTSMPGTSIQLPICWASTLARFVLTLSSFSRLNSIRAFDISISDDWSLNSSLEVIVASEIDSIVL